MDKNGRVVETCGNQHYPVRVNRSNRITLRNSRFLRKIFPVVNGPKRYTPKTSDPPLNSESPRQWIMKGTLTMLQVRPKATQNTYTRSNPYCQDKPRVIGYEPKDNRMSTQAHTSKDDLVNSSIVIERGAGIGRTGWSASGRIAIYSRRWYETVVTSLLFYRKKERNVVMDKLYYWKSYIQN